MQRFDVMHLATTAICFVLPGGHPRQRGRCASDHKTVTVTLPRAAASNEAVAVRISAGVLPDGARIIVRLPSGEIAGSVTPYGVRTGQKAGIYTIPLPQHAVANGTVTLPSSARSAASHARRRSRRWRRWRWCTCQCRGGRLGR